MIHREIHNKIRTERLMTSYTSAVHSHSLFQQPVKIILLAASKNSECSLKENVKENYFFFFSWTAHDGKRLRITNAKDLTAAVCYLLKQMGNILFLV